MLVLQVISGCISLSNTIFPFVFIFSHCSHFKAIMFCSHCVLSWLLAAFMLIMFYNADSMWHKLIYLYVFNLRGEKGERSLNQQAHQPLWVEDELIAAGFLVSKWVDQWKNKSYKVYSDSRGFTLLNLPLGYFSLSFYLMMVCMPLTWGVLSRTLRVWGRGWAWCAEARAAL